MNKCFIMSGIAGAGKSFWVDKFVSDWVKTEQETAHAENPNSVSVLYGSYEICSADHFFMRDGEYKFDPSLLGAAHKFCFRRFLESILDDISLIIVDNTNTTTAEISPYVLAAESYNYEVTVVRVLARVEDCVGRNVHGVPAHTIGAMSESMRREQLPPWWKLIEVDHRSDKNIRFHVCTKCGTMLVPEITNHKC